MVNILLLTLIIMKEFFRRDLVALDYEDGNIGSIGNTPKLKNVNELNELRIKRDGRSKISDNMTGILNPDVDNIINRENARMVEKKIVNNKPSQFGSILGVNFHNVKR